MKVKVIIAATLAVVVLTKLFTTVPQRHQLTAMAITAGGELLHALSVAIGALVQAVKS
jgi:hypothetical protein